MVRTTLSLSVIGMLSWPQLVRACTYPPASHSSWPTHILLSAIHPGRHISSCQSLIQGRAASAAIHLYNKPLGQAPGYGIPKAAIQGCMPKPTSYPSAASFLTAAGCFLSCFKGSSFLAIFRRVCICRLCLSIKQQHPPARQDHAMGGCCS